MDLVISKFGGKLKIANIQFEIISNKNKSRKGCGQFILDNELIQKKIIVQNNCREREGCISRNSFIPKANIRTRSLYETTRNLSNRPLNPAELTYSKFPIRKSKPKRRMSSATSICRQKIFSFGNAQIRDKLNTATSIHVDKIMRASAKSCGPLKGKDQSFKRYCNIQLTNPELKRGVRTAININGEDQDISQL